MDSRKRRMQYAIIGSGNIGSAVARQFARCDLQVGMATSRGVKAVAPLVNDIGAQVIPLDIIDALNADHVILAVPFDAVRSLLEQVPDWAGRIVIDATNAIDYKDFSPSDLGGRPSSELVEEWGRNSRVVKAFGSTWAKVLARTPNAGHGGRRVMFLAGNHPDANADVSHLVEQMGFAPIDLGRLDAGGLLIQFGGVLTTRSLISQPITGESPEQMDLAPVADAATP